jgi:hypothetical protein
MGYTFGPEGFLAAAAISVAGSRLQIASVQILSSRIKRKFSRLLAPS